MSFVILDALRIFGLINCKIVYYATDVFYLRLDNKNYKIKNKILMYTIKTLERVIWKRANYIFANRTDEASIIGSQNKRVSLVPAKSRFPNLTTLKLPNLDQGLIFYLLGHRVMFPTGSRKKFCKNLLARYY